MPSSRDYENFRLAFADGVAWIRIDSTSKYNSMNELLGQELQAIATDLGADEAVRCIVLTGTDGVFCAGADLGMYEGGTDPTGVRFRASIVGDAIEQFHTMATPLVTGVNGPAVGAGFSLALLGDVILVSEAAHLRYGFTGVGLPGDTGATFHLPRLVGLRIAKEIALFREEITPEEATELGIATEVVPEADFDDRLEGVATELASGPTAALGTAKRLLTESFANTLSEQLAAEIEAMSHGVRTDDHAEAVAAFLGNREPEFTGQ